MSLCMCLPVCLCLCACKGLLEKAFIVGCGWIKKTKNCKTTVAIEELIDTQERVKSIDINPSTAKQRDPKTRAYAYNPHTYARVGACVRACVGRAGLVSM